MGSLFRYVALGDSTGVGIGAQSDGGYPERLFSWLKNAGAPVGILNLSRSGATSREVLLEQAAVATSKRPALITLGIGVNDLWRRVPVGTFQLNVRGIAQQLAGSGADLVLTTMPDISLAPIAAMAETLIQLSVATVRNRVEAMNDVLRAVARQHRFELVDLFEVSRSELPHHPEYFHSDGFHPSARGYDRWTEVLWPTVQRLAHRWCEANGAGGLIPGPAKASGTSR